MTTASHPDSASAVVSSLTAKLPVTLDIRTGSARSIYTDCIYVTNKVDLLGVEILRYKYDANDRLTNRWSKAKTDTYYSYNNVGSLTNINYPASTDIGYQYDALNRLANMVGAAGI